MLDLIAFSVVSALSLLSVFLMISAKRLMHSAIYLALFFIFSSGILAILGAAFLAIIQILIFAGGIVVLIVMVVMLSEHSDEKEIIKEFRSFKVVASIALFAIVMLSFNFTNQPQPMKTFSISQLSDVVVNEYSMAVIASTIMLFSALVGSIYFLRGDKE